MRLSAIVTVPEVMRLVPFIRLLYTENGDDDLPDPSLDEFGNQLNEVMRFFVPFALLVHNPNEYSVDSLIIAEDEDYDISDRLECWVDTFISLVQSTAVPQWAKDAASEELVTFVSGLYSESVSYRDNMAEAWWLIDRWEDISVAVPSISPALHMFVGMARCLLCNGCGGRHMYYSPGFRRSLVLSFDFDENEFDIFEQSSDNKCGGSSEYCQEVGKIMRCNEGQASDTCQNGCKIGLCDECYQTHPCHELLMDE